VGFGDFVYRWRRGDDEADASGVEVDVSGVAYVDAVRSVVGPHL